jgi:hypothetical protein
MEIRVSILQVVAVACILGVVGLLCYKGNWIAASGWGLALWQQVVWLLEDGE